MSNEIKEILELFGSTDENVMFCDIVELNSKQSHLLLDYITNLQGQIEEMQEEIDNLKNPRNNDYESIRADEIHEMRKIC